jgi:Zn-dependent peptidase ImmA (M78 family)
MKKKGGRSGNSSELETRAFVVHLILDAKVEQALELLAKQYRTKLPRIEVGLPRRHGKNVFGCYVAKNQTIYVLNSEIMKQPFVVLHEFYHHLRTSVDKKHRGTEKYANDFAKTFIEAYKSVCTHRVSES